jgi:hypothetical protein
MGNVLKDNSSPKKKCSTPKFLKITAKYKYYANNSETSSPQSYCLSSNCLLHMRYLK